MKNNREKSVHDGHRQRLRERYRINGLDGFSDHEILELLLGYIIPRKDTNCIGHDLMERFGNLRGVFEAEEEDLKEVENMGECSAFFLKMIPDITRRYYEEIAEDYLRFIDTKRMVEFFSARFIGRKEECLYAAFLDENKRLIQCSLQFTGSINAVEIHAGKILKQAQRAGCSFVVIAHNHFNDTNPSVQDIAGTRYLKEHLAKCGIELLDHVIICGSAGTSMKESGHFAKIY